MEPVGEVGQDVWGEVIWLVLGNEVKRFSFELAIVSSHQDFLI